MGDVPAGWYADPQDSRWMRWWDGERWTEHRHQAEAPVPPPAASTPEASAPPPATQVTSSSRVPDPPARSRGGVFGSKKALESELQELRELVDGFGFEQRSALESEVKGLRAAADETRMQVDAARHELARLNSELVRVRDELILQEVGIYDYHHILEDSVAYKVAIDSLRQRIKEMSKKEGGAVTAATNWTVEGSQAKGRKMVGEFSKLLLRAYNGEADVLDNKLKPYKLDAAVDRLNKSRSTVSRLGATLGIEITHAFHLLRVEELRLTADYLAKKAEEKEAEREERERLREEAKARREFEQEKARLLKEKAHYTNALQRALAGGDPTEIAEAQARVAEIDGAIHGIEDREANIRAGYVYVISNVGTFGPGVVKIGMTRRLDPADRVRELGDASVPFRYDTHAIVFVDDAVTLEAQLHERFADRRVNLVNLRREFFYVAPDDVRVALEEMDCELVEFVNEPEADEWHQSENSRQRIEAALSPNAS